MARVPVVCSEGKGLWRAKAAHAGGAQLIGAEWRREWLGAGERARTAELEPLLDRLRRHHDRVMEQGGNAARHGADGSHPLW
eukprot:scaffold87765_cov62-Phaeocystis_antarctica.AAC.4